MKYLEYFVSGFECTELISHNLCVWERGEGRRIALNRNRDAPPFTAYSEFCVFIIADKDIRPTLYIKNVLYISKKRICYFKRKRIVHLFAYIS